MSVLKPRKEVPELQVPTLQGGPWSLREQAPESFTMVIFYRGAHCPVCKTYLAELETRLGQFTARGVDVIAVSSDGRERAALAQQDWGLDNLRIGYDLAITKAREWGLYISRGIKGNEPREFSEPGLFLIRPDQTLYCASVNTMPFARPRFNEVLNAIDFIVKNDYPARGEA